MPKGFNFTHQEKMHKSTSIQTVYHRSINKNQSRITYTNLQLNTSIARNRLFPRKLRLINLKQSIKSKITPVFKKHNLTKQITKVNPVKNYLIQSIRHFNLPKKISKKGFPTNKVIPTELIGKIKCHDLNP